MPNLKSAKKEMKASLTKRLYNDRRRRAARKSIKETRSAIVTDVKKAVELMPMTFQAIDKAAKRGVLKKNTANRLKSRITKAATKATAK